MCFENYVYNDVTFLKCLEHTAVLCPYSASDIQLHSMVLFHLLSLCKDVFL